jgi:hypothetical protein
MQKARVTTWHFRNLYDLFFITFFNLYFDNARPTIRTTVCCSLHLYSLGYAVVPVLPQGRTGTADSARSANGFTLL